MDEEYDFGPRLALDMSQLCRTNFSTLGHLIVDAVLTEVEFRQLIGRPCSSDLERITFYQGPNNMSVLTSVLAIPPDYFSGLPAVPFPKLKSISCHQMHFADTSALDAFTDCLMLRQKHGFPLHELVLRHCSKMTPIQKARLEQAVVNLEYTPGYYYEY